MRYGPFILVSNGRPINSRFVFVLRVELLLLPAAVLFLPEPALLIGRCPMLAAMSWAFFVWCRKSGSVRARRWGRICGTHCQDCLVRWTPRLAGVSVFVVCFCLCFVVSLISGVGSLAFLVAQSAQFIYSVVCGLECVQEWRPGSLDLQSTPAGPLLGLTLLRGKMQMLGTKATNATSNNKTSTTLVQRRRVQNDPTSVLVVGFGETTLLAVTSRVVLRFRSLLVLRFREPSSELLNQNPDPLQLNMLYMVEYDSKTGNDIVNTRKICTSSNAVAPAFFVEGWADLT